MRSFEELTRGDLFEGLSNSLNQRFGGGTANSIESRISAISADQIKDMAAAAAAFQERFPEHRPQAGEFVTVPEEEAPERAKAVVQNFTSLVTTMIVIRHRAGLGSTYDQEILDRIQEIPELKRMFKFAETREEAPHA